MIIYKKFSPPYEVFVHGPDVMSADSGRIFATLHHKAGGQIHSSQWIETEKNLVFCALCEAQDDTIRKEWEAQSNHPITNPMNTPQTPPNGEYIQ